MIVEPSLPDAHRLTDHERDHDYTGQMIGTFAVFGPPDDNTQRPCLLDPGLRFRTGAGSKNVNMILNPLWCVLMLYTRIKTGTCVSKDGLSTYMPIHSKEPEPWLGFTNGMVHCFSILFPLPGEHV